MERLWNRNYIKVMIANFMLYFAFYVLTPLLPIYLNEYFAASKDTIGMVLSGYTVAALIIRPFSGYLVDSFDRKHILLIFFSLFAACFIGYFWAGTLLVFAIVRTLHGAPFGAVTVANSTCAIDVLPSSRRNEGIGYYGLSNNLAMAIAPSFGLYIYHILQDFKWLFGVALITAFIGLAVLVTLETNSTRRPVQTNKKLSLDRFFLTRAWLLAINIALFGFCFGVLSNYLAIYSKEKYGGIVPVAIARGQSSAKRLYNPQYRPWHVAIPAGVHPVCRHAIPVRLLHLSHTYRSGQRPYVSRIPEYVYQCGPSQ